MSDKRDERIEARLEKMSSLFEHSDEKKQPEKKTVKSDASKEDILKEIPAELRVQALQNGMSLEALRELYAEVKLKYAAEKFEYLGTKRFENNERRQDNVRERVNEEERQRQNELTRTRSRNYERSRFRSA